ncbi:hypothetical protein HQ585_16840, partial [candidate division KSB1 bacterium]|nr:hypothetical protein [candidate division KSB1 bacterium]
MDWWDGGNTIGNRQLMKISGSLKQWLLNEHGLNVLPLPYYVEYGGLFLKDAAVQTELAGFGQTPEILAEGNECLNQLKEADA